MKNVNALLVLLISGVVTLTGCAAKKGLGDAGIAPSTSPAAVTAGETTPGASGSESEKKGATAPLAADSITAEDAARTRAVPQPKGSLDTIYFDFDAYLLGTEARETLTRNAALLNQDKAARVVIEGHADERGSDDYNLALSEKRAIAAKQYLEGLGIGAERLGVIAYGEDKPTLAGHDEAAWSKNRRVDFAGSR